MKNNRLFKILIGLISTIVIVGLVYLGVSYSNGEDNRSRTNSQVIEKKVSKKEESPDKREETEESNAETKQENQGGSKQSISQSKTTTGRTQNVITNSDKGINQSASNNKEESSNKNEDKKDDNNSTNQESQGNQQQSGSQSKQSSNNNAKNVITSPSQGSSSSNSSSGVIKSQEYGGKKISGNEGLGTTGKVFKSQKEAMEFGNSEVARLAKEDRKPRQFSVSKVAADDGSVLGWTVDIYLDNSATTNSNDKNESN